MGCLFATDDMVMVEDHSITTVIDNTPIKSKGCMGHKSFMKTGLYLLCCIIPSFQILSANIYQQIV
jgi:hypothetical protein